MPDLNPLKFQVAIQDDATKQLEKIETAFASLNDKTITVKVNGLEDLQQLLSALQHQQVQDIGKNVGSAINEATKNLQKEAQDAIRTSLGNLAKDLVSIKEAIQHDNFTAFSKRIEKCAESMNTLNDAFERFHVTIGKDEGMRNFMTGLGEVIRNVRQTMGMLNGGMTNATITPDAMSRSVKVAQHETERLNNDLTRAERTIETFGDKGFNVAALERYKTALIDVRENLRLIERNDGVHPLSGLTASQYLSSEDATRVVSLLKTELSYYKSIGNELERMANIRSTLTSILSTNTTTAYRGDINNAIAGLDLREGLLARQGARDAMQTLNSEAYRQQITEAISLISKVSAESRQSARDNAHLIESMRRAGIAVSDLSAKFDKLEIAKIRTNAVDAKVDTSAYDKAVERMERYRRVLEYIAQHGGHDADRITQSVGYRNASNDLNIQAAALKALTKEANSASSATNQLSAEQQRLAQALETSTNKLHGQSQVLSDLKSLATQYLGVWGGQQFLNNIIQIGGQLEMQRLSIGAILQNQAQANDLFNRIKGLATQSPFGVVELDQMTKQLTAYGFKYNELFDMTKRLADISAATGTGVDRLALALGHVRSEAALSGYTLRQFAMGNVPLLQKLSEKLGKSTEEIRKMVRAKQISYDDVVGVLKDLTDEGGMFHNMQEVISQSVKAKFKNVKDAMDIMYGEMAEGSIGDALKEVADVLMDVTRNWKDAATVIGTGTAMWALHRVAVIANIAVLGQHNAETLKNIAAFRAQEVQQLRTASMYRVLSAAEQQQIAISKQLTTWERVKIALGQSLSASRVRNLALGRQQQVMDLALALSSKKLTTEDIARQVALGKLSKAQARQIINLADLTAAERAAGIAAVNNTTRFGYMRMAFITAGDAALRLGRTLKALMFNPATLMMGGITAVVELWMRNSREMEKAGELGDSLFEKMTEGIKNVKNVMKETDMSFTISGKANIDNYGVKPGKITFPDASTLSTEQIAASIEVWETFIKNYSATPNVMLNAAYATDENGKAVHNLAEQYKILGENAITVMNALPLQKNVSTALEDAIKDADGGVLDDSLLTDLKDYDNAYKEHQKLISATVAAHKRESFAALNAAKSNAAFSKAIKDAGISAENYVAQIMLLADNQDKFAEAKKLFESGWGTEGDKSKSSSLFLTGKLKGQLEEVEAEFNQFAANIEKTLSGQGWVFKKLKPEEIQALTLGIAEMMTQAGMSVDETRDKVMQLCKDRWNIIIDAKTAEAAAKIAGLKDELDKLVGRKDKKFSIDVGTTTNFFEIIDAINKGYKSAKEIIEKAPAIMVRLGLKLDVSAAENLTDEEIVKMAAGDPVKEAALKSIRDAQKQVSDAMAASKAWGFKLDEPKKKSGSGQKAYKDEFAKRWDERIRIMKEAYGWYDKWEKKVGNDAAIAETNSKYEDIFKEWRTDKVLPMDFDVNKIADYQKYVEKIRDDALKRYQTQKNDKSKKNGEEALRVYRQAVALLNDIKFDNFIKAAEQFKSIIDQTIDDLNTRWEIYNTVREATGNESLAMDVAGITGSERSARNSADALKDELKRQFSSIGGMATLLEIDFDSKMDEESVRKMFENLVPADAKEKIDGLIAGFKEWQKLQKQVVKSDISSYTKLLGLVTNYDAQIKKINYRLEQQKKANNALVGTKNESGTVITQEMADKANNIAETQADWEKMQLSAQYANLYNNAIAMSRQEFDNATKAVEKMIERLKDLGLLSPEQAIQEQQKLDKAKTEYSTTGFLGEKGAVGQFISGGYEGLMGYYAKRRDKAQEKADKSEKGSQEQKDAQKEADHYGKLFKNMSELSDAAKDVITAFSTLQSGLDLVTNLFDSMGNDGAANAVGDAAGLMGGAMQGASSLSALGPWGMAAGAGLGLVSGLFQLHDKALQRQIDAIQDEVDALEANTEAIRTYRDRTLGYDSGDRRREMAKLYQDTTRTKELNLFGKPYQIKYESAALNAMREYYQMNSSGSGYAQELANLKQQREDYIKMYELENDKKNESQDALDEYRNKIAELDEQIRYFAEDIAKELWSIDIKSWADQISDALMSAFENGESAVKAFNDAVKSIMQSVASEMLKIGIIEPMMERLREKLFGKNGVTTTDKLASDPVAESKKVLATIADYFKPGGEGANMVTAAQEYLYGIDNLMQQMGYANGLRNTENANTLSSGIQGTSEETSDLLAGYVNALRQDVAIKRILLNQFITELWPMYVEQVASAVKALNNIDQNVAFIRALLSENGSIYVMIDSMKSHLDNITNGNEQISIK